MIIDISDILHEVGSSKAFEGDISIDGIVYQGEDIEFKKPFHANGNVVNGGESLFLNASLKGEAILECGSCMEPYSYPIDYDININFKPSLDEEDPDTYVYSGNRIDLKDVILREFLLRMPILRRCSKECKGLCRHCGINLNEAKCHCETEDEGEEQEHIDSRFAVLKELFPDEDREV